MAEHKVTLHDGYEIDGAKHHDVTLRELSASDIIDAAGEAERVVKTDQGAEIAISSTMLEIHQLRRQIVRVGPQEGPLSLAELRKLSAADLSILLGEADAINNAILEAFVRGRDGASS